MTYDYTCKQCGKVETKVHSMNDEPSYICCGAKMVKLLSVPLAIHGANTGARKGT